MTQNTKSKTAPAASGNAGPVAHKARVIELATEHFRRLCDERRTHAVPEWGVTVYARPIAAAQWQRISARNEHDGRMGALVEGIILFAEDENGDKMFSLEDRGRLLNEVEHTIIIDLGNWILSVQDLEQIVKN